MIPKPLILTPQPPGFLLGWFSAMHLFNCFLIALLCERDPQREGDAIGVLPIPGIGVHSCADG